MDSPEISEKLQAALADLFNEDLELLQRNASERAIAARLAVHISRYFPEYHVDVEYDRHGLEIKKLNLPVECRGGGRRRVIPDLIIHERGNDDRNLLAI